MEKPNTDRTCVRVFAQISAAISHEIKNSLSIINENAGLLEDYAQMAEHGGGVAVERVRSVTETIAKQVDRSNTIMKNLNSFAHSADTCLAHGNLKKNLSLVMALTNRQAAMKKITTSLDCPQDITIYTSLISFESLIYLTLLTLFANSAEASTLAIEVMDETPNISICFKTENKESPFLSMYPDDEQKLLADQIYASWRTDKNLLLLTFPAIIS